MVFLLNKWKGMSYKQTQHKTCRKAKRKRMTLLSLCIWREWKIKSCSFYALNKAICSLNYAYHVKHFIIDWIDGKDASFHIIYLKNLKTSDKLLSLLVRYLVDIKMNIELKAMVLLKERYSLPSLSYISVAWNRKIRANENVFFFFFLF